MKLKLLSNVLKIAICISLTSCFKCNDYFDVKDISGDNNIKMSIFCSNVVDLNFTIHYPLEGDTSIIIEDLSVIFTDLQGNKLNNDVKFSFYIDTYGLKMEEDIKNTDFVNFYDIPEKFRFPFFNINYIDYVINTDIEEDEYIVILKTTTKDSMGMKRNYENKYLIKMDTQCSFHFALH